MLAYLIKINNFLINLNKILQYKKKQQKTISVLNYRKKLDFK